MYYEVMGKGYPLVVIAGLGSTTRVCTPLAERFGQRYRTIIYDHRGVGRSSKPGVRYSLSMYADDLEGLLNHLSIEEANVLGMSMGGYVAQQFALDHPHRVNKLVLVSTAGHITDYMRRIGMMFRTMITGLSPERFARTLITLSFAAESVDRSPEMVAEAERLATPDPADVDGIKRQVSMLAGGDFSDRLGEIDLPVLVVVGRKDTLTPVKFSEMLASAIREARLVIMEHSAHSPLLEEPALCMKAVAGFQDGTS